MDRMKKIMFQMKKELLKLQAEKSAREEEDKSKRNINGVDIQVMKSSMDRSFETIRNKDYAIEKMKKDFEQVMKNKDQKIDMLEQLVSLRNDLPQSRDVLSEEKVVKLESEIKTLHFKLELANKKNNLISEKMVKRENELNAKRDKENETLKNNLKNAQAVIDELKMEKSKYDANPNEDLMKKDKVEAGFKKTDDEKDGTINVLTADKKALEEKFRVQGIELKKAEQKLKYTLSQLESSNKKKSSANSNKSVEVYAKQLDQASARMAEATAEVIEKRREIVKVKQENSMMLSKITELEKKLAILDKKVA
jgi:chromosome segregation ATPase